MPKRPISELECEDSHCLQSKIHVSNKEINQGICAASNMKAVYQRTLNLLFQGSKGKVTPTAPVLISPTVTLPSTPLPKYSQTVLTPDGQISSHPQLQQGPFPVVPSAPKCQSCSTESGHILERCRFCEGVFCNNCFRPCYVCAGDYCNKCSIQSFAKEESSICLSCATECGSL